MNLPADLKVSLQPDIDLSSHTTMQVGGKAAYFAEPVCDEEIVEAVEWARQGGLPWMILGKGSNVIFPDEGYPGLVISFSRFKNEKILVDRDCFQVEASSGVQLSRLAAACRDHGLGGAEFLAGIPGTLGGALVMNAGFSRFSGQRNEIGDVALQVTVLDREGRKEIRSRKDLSFSYRRSNLEEVIVLEAKLQLWRRRREEIDREIRANFEYRNRIQDLRYPSSGSIFKNPEPPIPSAGKLIDEAGLKGTCVGGIAVSPKHGNYFIKVGPAKSSDVTELIQKVQKTVFDATHIFLEPEVKIIERP